MCVYIYIYNCIYIYIYICIHVYTYVIYILNICIYVYTPNLPTNIVDFRGFGSSIMLCLRVGILISKGNLPEYLSQAMLVGIILVGRLGVGGLIMS